MFGFSTGLENTMHISLEEVVLIGKSRLCKQTLSVKGCSIPLTKVNFFSIGNIPLKKLTSLQIALFISIYFSEVVPVGCFTCTYVVNSRN